MGLEKSLGPEKTLGLAKNLSSNKNLGPELNLAFKHLRWLGWYTLLIIMPLHRPNPFGFFPLGRVWQFDKYLEYFKGFSQAGLQFTFLLAIHRRGRPKMMACINN